MKHQIKQNLVRKISPENSLFSNQAALLNSDEKMSYSDYPGTAVLVLEIGTFKHE